jgi:hypothetical protein
MGDHRNLIKILESEKNELMEEKFWMYSKVEELETQKNKLKIFEKKLIEKENLIKIEVESLQVILFLKAVVFHI